MGQNWVFLYAKYAEHKYLDSHSAVPYVYRCHLDHYGIQYTPAFVTAITSVIFVNPSVQCVFGKFVYTINKINLPSAHLFNWWIYTDLHSSYL